MQMPQGMHVHNHCALRGKKKQLQSLNAAITTQQSLFKTLLLWCQLKPGRESRTGKPQVSNKRTLRHQNSTRTPALAKTATSTTNKHFCTSRTFDALLLGICVQRIWTSKVFPLISSAFEQPDAKKTKSLIEKSVHEPVFEILKIREPFIFCDMRSSFRI